MKGKRWALLFLVIAIISAFVRTAAPVVAGKAKDPPSSIVAALSYAQAAVKKGNCPYIWGAQGPCSAGYDCSGLVFSAYHLPGSERTSEEQWASLPRVDNPKPGDLVYFHGYLTQGEAPPGHVGIVIGPHKMIDAYAVGFPVEVDTFGYPAGYPGQKDGLDTVWGYTSP